MPKRDVRGLTVFCIAMSLLPLLVFVFPPQTRGIWPGTPQLLGGILSGICVIFFSSFIVACKRTHVVIDRHGIEYHGLIKTRHIPVGEIERISAPMIRAGALCCQIDGAFKPLRISFVLQDEKTGQGLIEVLHEAMPDRLSEGLRTLTPEERRPEAFARFLRGRLTGAKKP
jgi:hypothetical protein